MNSPGWIQTVNADTLNVSVRPWGEGSAEAGRTGRRGPRARVPQSFISRDKSKGIMFRFLS